MGQLGEIATTGPLGFRKIHHEGDWVNRVLQRKVSYVLVGLAGLVLHLTLARPLYAWYDRLGAWLPLPVFLFLLYGYVRQARKSVPILLLAALQIYVFYSVPQFTQEALFLYSGLYEPSGHAMTTAVFLVIAGELAFVLGYRVTTGATENRSNLFDKMIPVPTAKWAGMVTLYAVPAVAIHVVISLRPDFIPVSVRLPLTQVFNAYLALVLTLYLAYRWRIRHMLVMAFLVSLAISFTGFVQGAMGNIVNPVMILFVAAWIWGGAIRNRWILLTLAAVFIINPAKNQFRKMEFSEKDVSSLAIVERRLDSWKVAFGDVWKENPTESNLLETASRASDLLSLAQAVDLVPSVIPYNYGEGMGVTLVYWIPRVVWPSKISSTDLLFNRYAIEFGYTTAEGTLTSTTGASAYTEGYWNLGAIGSVSFLFVIGMLLGLFFGNNGVRGDASTIVTMVYFASVMLLIGPLSLTASSLITFSAGVWLAMHGLHRLSGAQPGHSTHTVRTRPLVGGGVSGPQRLGR